MADINLLPQELKPNKSVLVIAKKLKKTALISGSLLILTFLVIIGLKYYYTKKTSESLAGQIELEAQIRSMEDTEQRLVLIKDRIEKITSISSLGTISEELGVVARVSEILPEGLVIKSISLDKDLVRISVLANNLTSVTNYINSTTSLTGLRYVNLISFEFSPNLGYTIDLNFIPASAIEAASVI